MTSDQQQQLPPCDTSPTRLIFEVRQNAGDRYATFAAFTYFGDAETYAVERSVQSPSVVVSIESHRGDYDVVWRKYEKGEEVYRDDRPV